MHRALANVLGDARGRWLFAPEHTDAASEWALAGIDDGAIAHVVLDRSFVADGVRWIVDFKTGGHEGADVEHFSIAKWSAIAISCIATRGSCRRSDDRPIRLGLYHPLLRGWREVAVCAAENERPKRGDGSVHRKSG